MLNIGQKIRELRDSLGISQNELALRLSVSDKTISKWETGGGLPDITQIVPLTQVFGVSTDELFGLPVPGIEQMLNALFEAQQAKRNNGDTAAAVAECERIGFGVINNSKDISDVVMAHSYLVGLYSEYGLTSKAEEHAFALPERPVTRDAMLGVIRQESGDNEGALPYFTSALCHNLCSTLSSITDIAMTYFDMEKYKESIFCNKAGIALVEAIYGSFANCYPANAHFSPQNIALAYCKLGDNESAIEWLEWTYRFYSAQSDLSTRKNTPFNLDSLNPENQKSESSRWKVVLKGIFSDPWFTLMQSLHGNERYMELVKKAAEIEL